MSILDWRELAPAPVPHNCNCENCDLVGEDEPIDWPVLVTVGKDYVTDRYMMIRAELAPVPDGYEGPAMEGPPDVAHRWTEPVSDKPADIALFRQQTALAMALTGWRLMLLDHPAKATDAARRRVGIVTADGEHIGWAIALTEATS